MSAFRIQNFLYLCGFSVSIFAIEGLRCYGPEMKSGKRMYLQQQGYGYSAGNEANPGPASFAAIIWSACNSIALLARNWGSKDLAACSLAVFGTLVNLDDQNGKFTIIT